MHDFNPDQFLGASFSESTDTRSIPCPIGDYPATAGDVKFRPWSSEKNGGSAGVTADITWETTDERACKACGRDKVLVKQGIMFTFLPGTETIDQEKAKTNIQFGKLREALGLNDGEFSFAMVPGRMAMIKVGHRQGNDGEMYGEVKATAKL